MSPLGLALGIALGLATAADLAASSEVGLEALPDAQGGPGGRSRIALSLSAEERGQWSALASGQLRAASGSWAVVADEADLHRLLLRYQRPDWTVRLGRLVRLYGGGLARLDGASLTWHPAGRLGGEAWVGRLGHPESLDEPGSLAAGAELQADLGQVGVSAGASADTSGSEHRLRTTLAADWVGARGSRAWASLEVGTSPQPQPDPGAWADRLRGEVRGHWIARPGVSTHGSLRWEGLATGALPASAEVLLERLAPRGYAVGDLAVEARASRWRLWFAAGPTMAPAQEGTPSWGASIDVRAERSGVALFARAMGIGDSGFAGGGASGATALGPWALSGEAMLGRQRGLDGDTAWVTETRLEAGLVMPGDPSIRVAVRVSAGADRLLAPWARATLQLQSRLGGP